MLVALGVHVPEPVNVVTVGTTATVAPATASDVEAVSVVNAPVLGVVLPIAALSIVPLVIRAAAGAIVARRAITHHSRAKSAALSFRCR